jgi:hypothetical protein
MVLPIIGGATLPANLAPVIQTDEGQAAAIIIDNKLSMWLGEWYLDLSQGTPWLTILGVKNPDLNAVRQVLQGIIAGTPPVNVVNDVSLAFDTTTRNLTWSWTATLDSGVVITGGSTPYVVPEGP